MNTKTKTLLGVLLLVVIITGATFTYNSLKSKYKPTDSLATPSSSAPVSALNSSDTESTSSAQEEALTPAPDFTVFDNDGKEVKLSDFFWETDCFKLLGELVSTLQKRDAIFQF